MGKVGWQGLEGAGPGKHGRRGLCKIKIGIEMCWLTQKPRLTFMIT